MTGLYPDLNEDPRTFLRRLREMEAAGKIRPNDRKIYDGGVDWALAEIAKQKSKEEINPAMEQHDD